MTKEEIKRLAERVVSGIATDEEIHLYNYIYNSFQHSDTEWKEELLGNKDELNMMMRNVILEKTTTEKSVIRMRWARWAAAVFIIAALSSVIFFISGNKKINTSTAGVKTQKERFKNDIAPGKEGAILTLSNGESILLDNANNGSLAQQGATEVIKKKGQIIYTTHKKSSGIVYNTMTTPKGRQYSLVLADGSKVWLNAASSITFPTAFTGKERKVTITGEAYFEIAHAYSPDGSLMPFIVQKGETSVQVLGTHFNVNTYEDESSINVTLLEGSVKVSTATATSLMKPGQQAQLGKEGIKLINDADIDVIMAWKNGLFNFEGADIGTLVRQLSRWYDVEMVSDKKVDELFYAAIPRNTNLSEVLRALELTGKVKFEIEGRKIKVLP